jgi:hypothetical protein
MATIQAKRLQDALKKAKNVGQVEEPVTIDGCPLVLGSLTPDAFEAIIAETTELEDVEYYHAYQIGHVCRSIIEIDGQDLRDVRFIEDEVPVDQYVISAAVVGKEVAEKIAAEINKVGKATIVPPDASDEQRVVKLERHEWIKANLLSTWSREAITATWRKFAELLIAADEKAKEGIKFKIPDETPEDKYRRLINELKEVEDELPSELTVNILEEAGYMSRSTPEELDAVAERVRKIADPEEPKAEEHPKPQSQSQEQEVVEQPSEEPKVASTISAQELMARRKPLNQQAIAAPVPQQQKSETTANVKAAVPEQLRKAAIANSAAQSSRSAQIAALEAQVDPSIIEATQAAELPQVPQEVSVLEKKVAPVASKAVAAITEQPPVVGINPRYSPPKRV